MSKLLSREEYLRQSAPFGTAGTNIPFGDPDTEWRRTGGEPFYIPHLPDGTDRDNEHFLVFVSPRGGLLALWTQSSCEGYGDNRIMLAKSADGLKFDEPKVLIKAGEGEKQACFAFAMTSKSGRIYVLYRREYAEFKSGRDQIAMSGIYSDDGGESWSAPRDIPLPRHPALDADDGFFTKNWIVWQLPLRIGSDYIVGCTVSGMKADSNPIPTWIHIDSRSFFITFENIDSDPEVCDIIAVWSPKDGLGVTDPQCARISVCQEPSIVELPDKRLFAVMRTASGCPYFTVRDNGEWSEPRPLVGKNGLPLPHPLSPCPIYRTSKGEYLFFFHNNNGDRLGFCQSITEPWKENQSAFVRNPLFLCRGRYEKGAPQPILFEEPTLFLDSGDIAVGPKATAETGTYTSYTEYNGVNTLWYPDRKYYLMRVEVK